MLQLLLSLPVKIIFGIFIFGYINTLRNKTAFEHYDDYFNINHDSIIFKCFMLSVVVAVILVLLSSVFPILVPLTTITYVAVYLTSWWWLFDSYKKGYVTTWYNDIKKHFKK